MSTIDFSKAMAVLSGRSVKPFIRGLCCMSFLFVKCVTIFSARVRERGKAIFYDLGYDKADNVLVSLNE